MANLFASLGNDRIQTKVFDSLLNATIPICLCKIYQEWWGKLSMPNITLVAKIFVAEVNHCSQCHLTSGRTDGPCKPFSNEPEACVNQAETNFCSSDMNAFVKCKISGKELLIN